MLFKENTFIWLSPSENWEETNERAHAQSLGRVRLFASPWIIAHQAPLSMASSRQEYWSGMTFPTPGDLPDWGTEPASSTSSAMAGGFFTTSTTWQAQETPLYPEAALAESRPRDKDLKGEGLEDSP